MSKLREMVKRIVEEETISPIEKEIAYSTGARDVKVHDFIKDNNINAVLLIKDLKTKKISALDVITAIAGKPGNKYFQKLIASYSN